MSAEITSVETRARHLDVIEYSARHYLEHLVKQRYDGALPSRLTAPADHLISTLRAALEKRQALSVEDVAFTAGDLTGVTANGAEHLINDWCLGFGDDGAKLLVMGTEEAYSAEHPEDLALWNCCGAVVWLSGGNRAVIERIDHRYASYGLVAGQPDNRRPFHIHSNDYFLVEQGRRIDGETRRAGRHTWVLLAQVLAGPNGDRMVYLGQGTGDLGNCAYQIEISAYPATKRSWGHEPTVARTEFLKRLAAEFRNTASVLLFHGHSKSPEWGGRDEIARGFLGLRPDERLELEPSPRFGSQQFFSMPRHGRTVLFTWALNGALRNDYLAAISELVRDFISVRDA